MNIVNKTVIHYVDFNTVKPGQVFRLKDTCNFYMMLQPGNHSLEGYLCAELSTGRIETFTMSTKVQLMDAVAHINELEPEAPKS